MTYVNNKFQTTMNENRRTIAIIVVSVFVLLALIVLGFLVSKKNKQASQAENQEKQQAFGNGKTAIPGEVLVQINSEVKLVNIETSQTKEASALDQGNFSGFAGAPQVDDKNLSGDVILVSLDKSKAIVEFGGQQYLCDIQQKSCAQTDLLKVAYQGLETANQEGSMIWWTAWDSKSNMIFGNITNNSSGDVSPVYACDTVNKVCDKTSGYNQFKDKGDVANVPRGAFSPSLGKFVMVNQYDIKDQQTGAKWELLLYDSGNLSKPLRSYDISAAINHDETVSYDSVYAVAWSEDEKKLAITTNSRIYLLDIDSGNLSLLYMVETDEDADTYLDNSMLGFAADNKFVTFVEDEDNDSTESDQDDAPIIGVLKKINLEKNNEVSEVIRGNDLSIKTWNLCGF